jgi:receptor expression-enhancing protein 5/6
MNTSQTQHDWKEWAQAQAVIVEKHTGIPAKIILPILGACCFIVLIGYLESYITTAVGTIYPIYWSLKALETEGQNDDSQWLTYWIVFALFTFIDQFSGFILRFLPFYFFFKIVFLIWCFMPNTRGATVVYNTVIRQLFKTYEKDLDNLNEKVNQKLGQAVSGVVDQTKTMINENKGNLIKGAMDLADKVNEITAEKKDK